MTTRNNAAIMIAQIFFKIVNFVYIDKLTVLGYNKYH
jgi:hypothetical protein